MRNRRSRAVWLLITLMVATAAVSIANSFRFDPDSSADEIFIARAQHATAPGLKVSVSALGPEESERSFGASLAKYGIQPVWPAIENDTDEEISYLPIVTDPTIIRHMRFRSELKESFRPPRTGRAMLFFSANRLQASRRRHSRIEGFVFGRLTPA